MSHLIGSDDDPRWVDFVRGGGEYNQGKDAPCSVCGRVVRSGDLWHQHDKAGPESSITQGRAFVDANPPGGASA